MIGKHKAAVQAVAFAPDGSRVVSASDDQTIAIWDVTWRRFLPQLLTNNQFVGTHTTPVRSIAFSPNGDRLISGEYDKSVRIYTRRRTLSAILGLTVPQIV